MGRQHLDSIFNPQSVAVVGASEQPGSVGGAVYRNLQQLPAGIRLLAVNRKHDMVYGQPAYATLQELPEAPDLLVICTPAPTVAGLVREFGQLGGRGVVVISAGFREAGAVGREYEEQLRQARRAFPEMRIIGPNCLGILRPSIGLNASFSPVMPLPGGLTFLSQSGALVTGILDWSLDHEIGFSACVSTGNMLDVGMGDLIDYFAADPQTEALLLYIESLDDPRHFMAAARACTRRKPILAYKSGRFAESSQAAASHTGAIASLDAVYDAAFRRAGIERVNSIEELFDGARLLAGHRPLSGDRLAIVTNAGGPGVMACDAWLARRGKLSKLSPATLETLNRSLPSCWSHGNPVDVLGDATAERYQLAIESALADPQVDAVLVLLTPQTMTDPEGIAEVVIRARAASTKTIVASWIGGPVVAGGRNRLKKAGLPVYEFPEEAVDALAHLASCRQLRDSSSAYIPAPSGMDRSKAPAMTSSDSHTRGRRQIWRERLQATEGLLGEVVSKELFQDYGIPVVQTRVAHSAEDAVAIADELTYPVVMKVLSPEISHKTDVGGVLLNLANAEDVRHGYLQILSSVKQRAPEAHVEGISVQRMVSATRGVELLLGMTRDPQFGPVILLGAGGITAELQRDSCLELPPVEDSRIDRMLRSLRLYPLLEGYRGRPGIHLGQLREVVARFVQLVEDLPEIATAEINPLLVTSDDVVALDARLVSGGNSLSSHGVAQPLAIHPYPNEWCRTTRLKNGQTIRIRPAFPGDESAWSAWIRRSDVAAWLSRSATVWWADFPRFPERGVYLDYQSELLLIARNEWGDWCGTAILHCPERAVTRRENRINDDQQTVLFDLFVREDSRLQGLGTILRTFGVEIAKQWNAVAMETRLNEAGEGEVEWLRRNGFVEQSTAGLRFRKRC